MKYILAILIFTVFRLEASASCMVWAKTTGNSVNVSLWKHTDNKADDVMTRNFKNEEVSPLANLLKTCDSVKLIFNDNKFTAMRYEGGKTVRWDALTSKEREAIFFLKKKFDVGEQ